MTKGLRILYIGAGILAAVASVLGSYDYFVAGGPDRSLVGDVLVPLGAFIVIAFLYRRRKEDLEKGSRLG